MGGGRAGLGRSNILEVVLHERDGDDIGFCGLLPCKDAESANSCRLMGCCSPSGLSAMIWSDKDNAGDRIALFLKLSSNSKISKHAVKNL